MERLSWQRKVGGKAWHLFLVRHYVGRAHDRQDWGEVRAVAVDDTATRKGHRYATVVVEIDPQQAQPARLLFMTPERTAVSVGEFAAAMPAHGAKPDQVLPEGFARAPAQGRDRV